MTFSITAILNVIWLVSTILLALTLASIAIRGLHRDLPWFTRYLYVVLGKAPILFVLRKDYFSYFYTYWTFEAVIAVLSMFVIYEIYRQVFDSSHITITRSTFFSLCVAWVALAAVIAFFLGAADPSPTIRAILVLTQTVKIVQVGMLALLLVASVFFNFYWRSMPFGVALGYGIYATIELVATISRAVVGHHVSTDSATTNNVWALTKVLGYQIAIVIWMLFAYRHNPAPALDKLPPESAGEWLRPLRKVAE